jgi:peptide/nickel transport system permease protein
MTLSFARVSTPHFVLGLTLLYLFAYLLSWLPLGGYGSFPHLILPALTLGLAGGGWYSLMMRSSMIEVFHDYIRRRGPSPAGAPCSITASATPCCRSSPSWASTWAI